MFGLGTGSRTENKKVTEMIKYERRYLDRFMIPGAKIHYQLQNGFSATTNLIDFTKISARFYVNHKMQAGDIIDLDIIAKRKEKISVKGHVVWTHEQNKSIAVVQFLPFGTDKKINSMVDTL